MYGGAIEGLPTELLSLGVDVGARDTALGLVSVCGAVDEMSVDMLKPQSSAQVP